MYAIKNNTAPSSVSNILIGLSIVATVLASIVPEMRLYGMNTWAILSGDIVGVALQFALYQFLHGGILHLVSNGLFLFIFGNQVEWLLGRSKFFGFFLLNTIFTGVTLLVFSSGNTIGVSGFAMAVLAYLCMDLRDRHDPEWRGAGLFLFINVAIGLSGDISLVGHLAGAVFGAGYFWVRSRFSSRFFR